MQTITQTGGVTIEIIGFRSMQIAKSAIMEIEELKWNGPRARSEATTEEYVFWERDSL